MNNLGLPLPEKIMEALQCNVSAMLDTEMKFPKISELNEIKQLEPQRVYAQIRGIQRWTLIDIISTQ